MGIAGATLITAAEGFGRDRRIHSAHFFELGDQPVEVVMAVSEEEADRLFTKLKTDMVKIFYVKAPVEFGTTGGQG